MGLVDVNPQVNDSSDGFWRNTFPDLNLNHPETAYFHRDASGGDRKVIFYLSDVKEDNSPFSYAVVSHKMGFKRIDDYICEANDSNGLAATKKSSREMFASSPKRLRQKGNFGNDLTGRDTLKEKMLNSTWRVEVPAGTLVLFDTKGIPRGGLVEQVVRKVVTCIIG